VKSTVDVDSLLRRQRQSVVDGRVADAVALAEEAMAAGVDPRLCIEGGYVEGIEEVGRLWAEGEFFLPELMQGADAMKAAMAVLRPTLLAAGEASAEGPAIVIGTVQGDIHDIGKTLVATFLEANGFRVVDLGRDVPLGAFVDAAEREAAPLIGLSALLTTTMPGQRGVVEMLQQRGLRSRVSVMVGGAPVTRAYAESIGADGYAANAVAAVAEARRLVGARA
jgi:corrinoid protein of di/trimethylamine methyltransferase